MATRRLILGETELSRIKTLEFFELAKKERIHLLNNCIARDFANAPSRRLLVSLFDYVGTCFALKSFVIDISNVTWLHLTYMHLCSPQSSEGLFCRSA
jgi:hypothetical protein